MRWSRRLPPERHLLLVGADARTVAVPGWTTRRVDALAVEPGAIDSLKGHDAAVLLTAPGEAPWGPAYLLYLAGVPVRIGRSAEFGGALLSRCLPADADDEALLAALWENAA